MLYNDSYHYITLTGIWDLAQESQHKSSNVESLSTLVANKERMKTVGDLPWLGSDLQIPFSALKLVTGIAFNM